MASDNSETLQTLMDKYRSLTPDNQKDIRLMMAKVVEEKGYKISQAEFMNQREVRDLLIIYIAVVLKLGQ